MRTDDLRVPGTMYATEDSWGDVVGVVTGNGGMASVEEFDDTGDGAVIRIRPLSIIDSLKEPYQSRTWEYLMVLILLYRGCPSLSNSGSRFDD